MLPKSVKLTANSKTTEVYDGTEKTVEGFTCDVEGLTFEGVSASGKGSDAGEYVVNFSGVTLNETKDTTGNFTVVEINPGKLIIHPQSVMLTANSKTKEVYDGTEKSVEGFTCSVEGLTFEGVSASGKGTEVGQYEVAFTGVTDTTRDTTGNYLVTQTVQGTLEVVQKPLTITADSAQKVYDATALTKNSYTDTGLANGDTFKSIKVAGSQTSVGKSDNVVSDAVITNASGTDVTNCYEISYENGTLEVTEKAITITADSAKKVYDATELTKDGYISTELANGDTFKSVMVAGSQTIVGKSENVASNAVITNAAGFDVTDYYTITYVNGTLEVTQKSITITADSDMKVYDATELTKDSYTSTELATGDAFKSVKVAGTQTNVGKSDNVASDAVITNAAGTDVTDSYEITYIKGTLEVTPKPVTLTAGDAEKIYDATPLTQPEFAATALADTDDHEFSVVMTDASAITDVGTTSNVIATVDNTAVMTGEETPVGNYLVTVEDGTLTITAKAVTITASDAEKIYDGAPLVQPLFTASALESSDAHVFTVEMTPESTITDAGEIANVVAAVDGVAVEIGTATTVGNYEVTTVEGLLRINPRKVTSLHMEQVPGSTRFKFLATLTLDNSDGANLSAISYKGLTLNFTQGSGNAYPMSAAEWSGVIEGFQAEEQHDSVVQAKLVAVENGNFVVGDDAAASNEVVADFKAMDGKATFKNRDHEAVVDVNDSLVSGSLTVGGSTSPINHLENGGSTQVPVTWSGSSLIHSGTGISGQYVDKFGNPGRISGTVGMSAAKAPITVKLNSSTFNKRNSLVTISGTAWGYETIRISVTGAGGWSETTTIAGSGDYDSAGSGPYNWVFSPRVGEDGEYFVSVSYDDLSGGSASTSFTVDRAVKPNVVIMRPYDYASFAVVAGITEPNAAVTLTINDYELAKGRADSQGYYRLIGEVPNDPNNDALIGRVDRTNYLVLNITDGAGNTENIVFDQFSHSNENYQARIVGLGKWVVDEDDKVNWATATPLNEGTTTVPLLLGGVYKVGELRVKRSGNTVSATISDDDDSFLNNDLITSLNEKLLVFNGKPSMSDVLNGSDKMATLKNGGSVTLEADADAALYLVANIDIQVSDIDEMLYQVADQPYDLSGSQLYNG